MRIYLISLMFMGIAAVDASAQTGAIRGQAFIQTPSHGLQTCTGQSEVKIIKYEDGVEILQPEATEAVLNIPETKDINSLHTSPCDAQGWFEFSDLDAGEYILISEIDWIDGNASIVKKISVEPNSQVRSILTGRYSLVNEKKSTSDPMDHMIQRAEAHFRSSLIDPDSARFSWSRKILEGQDFKAHNFARKIPGTAFCGWVNSRNRMGGYTGKTAVVVVFNEGRIVYANMDSGGEWGLTQGRCLALGLL